MGDHHVADKLLLGHTGVGVAAKNGVEFGELGGSLHVFLEAAVVEEKHRVAFLEECGQILGQHLRERAEMGAASVFRMEVGEAVLTQLDATYNTDFQSVTFKYPIRINVGHLERVVEGDVGTDKGELGPS